MQMLVVLFVCHQPQVHRIAAPALETAMVDLEHARVFCIAKRKRNSVRSETLTADVSMTVAIARAARLPKPALVLPSDDDLREEALRNGLVDAGQRLQLAPRKALM